MKKSELKNIIKEVLTEAHGDERHQKEVIDDLIDALDEAFMKLEVLVQGVLKHHDVTFLKKVPIEDIMFKGVKYPQVQKDLEVAIKKVWGK